MTVKTHSRQAARIALLETVDPANLKKGDRVEYRTIARVYRVAWDDVVAGTTNWRFTVQDAVTTIRRELRNLGHVWTLCERDGAVHVLDDSDALEYNRSRDASAMRIIRKACRQRLGIDRSKLSEHELRQYDADVARSAAVQVTYKDPSRAIAKAPPVKRLTPGIDTYK